MAACQLGSGRGLTEATGHLSLVWVMADEDAAVPRLSECLRVLLPGPKSGDGVTDPWQQGQRGLCARLTSLQVAHHGCVWSGFQAPGSGVNVCVGVQVPLEQGDCRAPWVQIARDVAALGNPGCFFVSDVHTLAPFYNTETRR